jgi:MFS transporter, DHA1 family, tetracycline resistance protein
MPIAKPVEWAQPAASRARSPLVVLFVTVFVDLLGFGIVIPFLPMYAQRLHVGALGVGLILSIYSFMQLLCAPLLGRLSDHYGRRPIILLGLFGSSLSYAIYGFASSFGVLLLSRAMHGACAGTISTAQAYVADTTTESQRAHGMGLIGAAFGLGFVFGPGLGGLLGHSSLRVPVFFAALLTLANLVFAAFALPESHSPNVSARLDWGTVVAPIVRLPWQLTRDRRSGLFAIAFLATFAIAGFETTFTLMVPRIYGYAAGGIGALLAFAGLVQAFTQGYVVRKAVARAGEQRLVQIGLLALALGMAPMASTSSIVLLMMLLAMLSVGYGLASPSVASLISKRTERQLQGEVLGVNQSALSLARICGPIAAGIAYEMVGPGAAYFGGGVAALLALALSRKLGSKG